MMVDVQVRQTGSTARRVRLLLRDGTELEAGVHLVAGQALAPYLSSRKSGWVNLVNVRWPGNAEELPHMVLQSSHLVAALPLDPGIPVFAATLSQEARVVEIRLEDGRRLRGRLYLGERQRLADFLHTSGSFIPCSDCVWMGGESLGTIVLHTGAVRELHDVTDTKTA